MPVYVALLRGINVGGKNSLPMTDLVQIMKAHGCTDVQTYIQSGNVVFQYPRGKTNKLALDMSKAILDGNGFRPGIMILKADSFKQVAAHNPYPAAEVAPKSLHVFFLNTVPKCPDFEALEKLKTKTESFSLIKNAFFLYAPDGIGRSKLAAKTEQLLGVPATARNWNTVLALLEMTGK